jgi:hypothetical protein
MNTLSEYFDIAEFDYEGNKKKLIDNLNHLKAMSVEEQTFYKKWIEVQELQNYRDRAAIAKNKIWLPEDLNDEKKTIKEIENLKPTVVYVNDSILDNDWVMLRTFVHTMAYDQTPGRFIKLLISDGNVDNPRYLGVISMSSDVITITDRDNYIGWTPDAKLKAKKLNNSAIGSCIMSTQPFGYNFLGGKLVAGLVTGETIRNLWKQLYGQTLAGITTTSLYGSYSMYNSLKWWHKCGTSAGKMTIKPDDGIYKIWHDWIKENKAEKYQKAMTQREGVSGPVTGAKNRVLSMIFSQCNIKSSDYVHGFERGTYYACPYHNSREFLKGEILEDMLKPNSIYTENYIIDWWKQKAISRYKTLKSEHRLKPDVLYYNKMIGMPYDEAKKLYFAEVGR